MSGTKQAEIDRLLQAEKIYATDSVTNIRRRNRDSILKLLRGEEAMSRAQLSRQSGLTAGAVSRITRELIDADLIMENSGTVSSGRAGRREVLLAINAPGAYVLGVSLTANKRSIALANAAGNVLGEKDLSNASHQHPGRVLGAIAVHAKSLAFDCGIDRTRLLGIGVSAAASPGTTGEILNSVHLGWSGVRVPEILEKQLGIPVKMVPRATALLKAELVRRSRSENLYLLNVALGTGSSTHLDGKIMNPSSVGIGSLAHLVLDPKGPSCVCGRRGCLEVYAPGAAILRALSLSSISASNPAQKLHQAIDLANRGDAQAAQVFRKAGRRLGQGVDAVLSLLGNCTVLLAGEVVRQQDYAAGVLGILRELGRDNPEERVKFCGVRSQEAAISVALHEFVFSERLNIRQLRAV